MRRRRQKVNPRSIPPLNAQLACVAHHEGTWLVLKQWKEIENNTFDGIISIMIGFSVEQSLFLFQSHGGEFEDKILGKLNVFS